MQDRPDPACQRPLDKSLHQPGQDEQEGDYTWQQYPRRDVLVERADDRLAYLLVH